MVIIIYFMKVLSGNRESGVYSVMGREKDLGKELSEAGIKYKVTVKSIKVGM